MHLTVTLKVSFLFGYLHYSVLTISATVVISAGVVRQQPPIILAPAANQRGTKALN